MDKIKEIMLRYPDLFRNGNCACGFHVDDGWLPMIDNLCRIVDDHLKNDPRSYKVVDAEKHKCRMRKEIYIDQVKEKFGTLRVYFNRSDEFIDGVVAATEAMSAIVCEKCGSPGTRRSGGWIKTNCEPCFLKRGKRGT